MGLRNLLNNYYYGKQGKADYTIENMPQNRRQLFAEVLKVRWSALFGVNLLYMIFWIPAIAWTVLNAMALVNLLVVLLVWVLESEHLVKHVTTKLVLYDRIELIVPEKRAELIADLEQRLGVKVDSVEIGHVDFLKDAAFIKVSYKLGKGEANTINQLTRAKDYVE